MEQIGKERFFTMAETYDRMAQILVPMYDMLQNEIFNIVPFDKSQTITVVDLGAGSGILLEKILSLYPNSIGYWVDFSDAFLGVAENRLRKFNNRISCRFICIPACSPCAMEGFVQEICTSQGKS